MSATDSVTKSSPWPVPQTVDTLSAAITGRGMTLFAVIDQQAAADSAGLEMPAMTLIVFGNPVAGTPLMVANPLAGLDLPLKLLVWADGEQTKVSYLDPAALAERYGLDAGLTTPLAGINALTDAVLGAA